MLLAATTTIRAVILCPMNRPGAERGERAAARAKARGGVARAPGGRTAQPGTTPPGPVAKKRQDPSAISAALSRPVA